MRSLKRFIGVAMACLLAIEPMQVYALEASVFDDDVFESAVETDTFDSFEYAEDVYGDGSVNVSPLQKKVESITFPDAYRDCRVVELDGDRVFPAFKVLPEDAADRTVTWSSSNDKVAYINELGITDSVGNPMVELIVVGLGTTKITATANDGSGVSASYDVIVVNKAPNDIVLCKKSITLFEGDTYQVGVISSDADAGVYKYSYKSDNEASVTVSDTGVVTGVSAGNARVTVKLAGTSSLGLLNVNVYPKADMIMVEGQKTTLSAGQTTKEVKMSDDLCTLKVKNKKKKTFQVTADVAGFLTLTGYDAAGGETFVKKILIEEPEIADTTLVAKTDKVIGKSYNVNDFIGGATYSKPTKFKTSNKKVIKVAKDGTMTVLKSGKATITVSYGKKSIKGKFNVTVPAIKESTIKVKKGATKPLTIQNVDLKELSRHEIYEFRVEKSNVATVTNESGEVKVTGVSKGTTTVSFLINGVEVDKCKIKVK